MSGVRFAKTEEVKVITLDRAERHNPDYKADTAKSWAAVSLVGGGDLLADRSLARADGSCMCPNGDSKSNTWKCRHVNHKHENTTNVYSCVVLCNNASSYICKTCTLLVCQLCIAEHNRDHLRDALVKPVLLARACCSSSHHGDRKILSGKTVHVCKDASCNKLGMDFCSSCWKSHSHKHEMAKLALEAKRLANSCSRSDHVGDRVIPSGKASHVCKDKWCSKQGFLFCTGCWSAHSAKH
jgi:hypothetical protein